MTHTTSQVYNVVRLEDLDYDLPEAAIAQTPLEDRAASKLLWLPRESGPPYDRTFRDVIDILDAGDLLVLNDTRVTALRLFGEKRTGGKIEVLLLKQQAAGLYQALARPGKRLQPGSELLFNNELKATVVDNLPDGQKLIQFEESPNLASKLAEVGLVPLPPYIRARLEDAERYQTVYANQGGSAAAPTAGLHFTPEILQALTDKGVQIARVTLDVGLDTFRPISAENPLQHQIHGETCHLPEDTKRAVANAKGRIVAVGTTAVRTLESFASGRRRVDSGSKKTDLFITPGFEFQIVDGMFTNFHMPRTTMLLMISAMATHDRVMSAYRHALDGGYRFLSFGDSMLIL